MRKTVDRTKDKIENVNKGTLEIKHNRSNFLPISRSYNLLFKIALGTSKRKEEDIRKEIFEILKSKMRIPIAQSGLNAGRPWTADTLRGYRSGRAQPGDDGELHVLEAIVDVVVQSTHPRRRETVDRIVAECRRAKDENALAEWLRYAVVPSAPGWVGSPAYRPVISATFSEPTWQGTATRLEEEARRVLDHLSDGRNGVRVALIQGARYAGKKTVLKCFVAADNGHFLRLRDDDGTRIPIFAASALDMTAGELVDRMLAFYRTAEPRHETIDEVAASHDFAAKIALIRTLARTVPACVVLSDFDRMAEEPVVRCLSEGHVEKVTDAVLRGHPQSRVAITVHGVPAMRVPEHVAVEIVRVERALDLAQFLRGLKLEGRVLPEHARAKCSGLAGRLAEVALALACRLLNAEQRDRIGKAVVRALERDAVGGEGADTLAELIWRRILDRRAQRLVGMIAASHDGLRTSVIGRMIPSTVARANGWREMLDMFAERRVGLVHARKIEHNDPALVARGDPPDDDLWSIEPGWRDRLLTLWWAQDPARARSVFWLIAREAAEQSRTLRVEGPQPRSAASLGRDVQALHALVHSVDPRRGKRAEEFDWATHPTVRFGEDAGHLETVVLPPLGRAAERPDDRIVLRYALHQLYRRDIEGEDFRRLLVDEDASTRRGVLLPFFYPDRPWEDAATRTLEMANDTDLDRRWDAYRHLKIFRPHERIELLTAVAIAATRLGDYRLVSNAVRLGEAVVCRADADGVLRYDPAAAPDLDVLAYVRLLRAEIDAALLLGLNPDAIGSRSSGQERHRSRGLRGVLEIVRRIRADLLNGQLGAGGRSDNDFAAARGKLLVRYAEALHLAGSPGQALAAFAQAERIERRLVHCGAGSALSPVLGGRGIGSLIRLRLDMARRAQRSSARRARPGDALAILLPGALDAQSPELQRIEALLAVNARRVSHGRAIDAIGLKIDAARIAAARHRFDLAMPLLEKARDALHFTSGTSMELVLELFAVHARSLVDSAVHAMLRSESVPAISIAGAIGEAHAACRALADLARHVTSNATRLDRNPAALRARYLDAIVLILPHLRRDGRHEVPEEAVRRLEAAIDHMDDTGCRIDLDEAAALLRAIIPARRRKRR
ncbi:MAG: hypothetical protein AB7P02_27300 [Alphaproteobacteria bacterium]